ncbi:hypothetical protein [Anderseniella sp. Alg231-50]|uniref:hypothetical protein n=1 Tax=Anderseniella sp. Alg231-50 TaxID=1922226 RepID=UPI00307C9B9F
MLEQLSYIAQIAGFAVASLVGIVALLQFRKSIAHRRREFAVSVVREWDAGVSELTKPATEFVRANNDNLDLLTALKQSQDLQLSGEKHRSEVYGFLVNENGVIPGVEANRLRTELVRYLNVLESTAQQYLERKLDRSYIHGQLGTQKIEDLLPFMDLYSKESWEQLRLMHELRKSK